MLNIANIRVQTKKREMFSQKSVSWNFDDSSVMQYVLGVVFLVSALNRSISP